MNNAITQRLTPFHQAGIISYLDGQVAHTLARLGQVQAPDVALAASLASRAPRFGHICVELDRVAELEELASPHATLDDPDRRLAWPEPEPWRQELLAATSLVREGTADDGAVTPLVLDGIQLYLDRYWCRQQELLSELEQRAQRRRNDFDAQTLRQDLHRLFGPPPQDQEVDRQQLAALMTLLRGLTVISGGPGTGKTTTVKKILALLLEQAAGRPGCQDPPRPLRLAVAAPTAKAAARLGESMGEAWRGPELSPAVQQALAALQPVTVHRLLGAGRRPGEFRYHRDEPLPFDVVVVDEASMIDFVLMARLVTAVPPKARLILLGDQDQLASVEAGSVLGDLCGGNNDRQLIFSHGFAKEIHQAAGQNLSGQVALRDRSGIWDCMVHLTKVYRFKQDSGIRALSEAINRGPAGADVALSCLGVDRQQFSPEPRAHDFPDLFYFELDSDQSTLPARALAVAFQEYGPFLDAVERNEASEALDAFNAFRVLCAHRRGGLGVEGVVLQLEEALRRRRPGFDPSHRWYRGRPVVIRANDYRAELFNGDVGIVLADQGRADQSGGRRVAFRTNAGPRFVGVARLPRHETVWATTVHQAQGSQFDHVMVVLPNRPSPIVTQELVYTAVTRARQKVTIVGTAAGLRSALAQRVQRASGLRAKLWPEESRDPPLPPPTPPPEVAPY
jgi:exodeoxyribonuclease V alpha subunit